MGLLDKLTGADKAKDAAKEQERALKAQAAITDRQLDISEEQNERYRNIFRPLEDDAVAQALDYGSFAGQERAAGEVRDAVAGGYGNLRRRLLETPGLDVNSDKYKNTLAKIKLQEAAQSAAAQTGARRDTAAQGEMMMSDALALGKGLASAASAQFGAAANTAAARSAAATRDASLAGQQQINTFGAIGDMLGSKTGQTLLNRGVGFVGGLFQSAAPGLSTGVASAPMTSFDLPAGTFGL